MGQAYSDWIRVNVPNGIDYATIAGSLPPGLSIAISGTQIIVTGTPTTVGIYRFTLAAIDKQNGYNEKEFSISVKGNVSPIQVFFSFVDGKAGVSYSDMLYAYGGTAPYRAERISGTVPADLYFTSSGNLIYLRGIPKRSGEFSFTLRISDSAGNYVDKPYVLKIADNPSYFSGGAGEETDTPSKPKIVTSKLPDGSAGNEYLIRLEASGTRPMSWDIIDGELPDGLVIDEDGTIAGTLAFSGKSKFKVRATNPEGTATKKYTLKVKPAKPVISTTVVPDAVAGEPYTFRVEASGGEIKFSKKGKLPKGLKLNKYTGEITGTPTKAGEYTFSIKAKNKSGTDIVEFTMTVSEEAETKDSVAAANVGVRPADYSVEVAELFVLKEASAGMPLTFRIGDPDDGEVSASNVRVFVNDEQVDGIEVAMDGTFTLPGELVDGKFSVYASGVIDGKEFETTEVDVEVAGGNVSGSCNAGLYGMLMLLVFFKKK